MLDASDCQLNPSINTASSHDLCNRAPEDAVVSEARGNYGLRRDFDGDSRPPAVLTIFRNNRGPAGKHYELGKDGKLKYSPNATLYDAEAGQVPILDVDDLKPILKNATARHALCCGAFASEHASVTTKDNLKPGDNKVARTREHMGWRSGPGVFPVDVDGWDGTREEFNALMCKTVPWWNEADRLYDWSSSSGIATTDGKLLKKHKTFRVFMIVDDARKIPALGVETHVALWNAGRGKVILSASGALLDRSPVDWTVYEPERLFFIRPSFGPSLKRIEQEPLIIRGKNRRLATEGKGLGISLKEWRPQSPEYQAARKAIKPERDRLIKRLTAEAVAKAIAEGEPEAAARERAERLYGRQELTGDSKLLLENGEIVTVAQILRNRDKYDGLCCADPAEPDYRNDPRIGYIRTKDGEPHVWSFAHGGIYYRLLWRPAGYDPAKALEDLPKRTNDDAGAPFDPDAINDMALLHQRDLGAFEGLLGKLKKAGCRVGELRKLVKDAGERMRSGIDFDDVDEAEREANEERTRIEELNKRYAFIKDRGGHAAIMEKTIAADGSSVVKFRSFWDFEKDLSNQKITHGKKTIPAGKYWLEHWRRRTFRGLILDPKAEKEVNNYYNLWDGFAVKAIKGDWTLMRRHVEMVIAAADAEYARYILHWLAWAFQNPGDPAEVALVLRSGEGTGKGILARAVNRIFGKYGLHLNKPELLTGRFNGHFENACYAFADEAFFAGDKAARGALYGMITEPTTTIEVKGLTPIQAPNRLKLIFASNAGWVVPAGRDARRWAVFDVSEAHKGDRAYFSALRRELESGGLEAMLYDLLAMDLKGWHPRDDVPQTDALREQKELSLSPELAFLLDLLDEGELPDGDFDKKRLSNETTAKALEWKLRNSAPKTSRITHLTLPRLLPKWKCEKRRESEGIVWTFPALKEMRADWCKRYGSRGWDNPEYDWGGEF